MKNLSWRRSDSKSVRQDSQESTVSTQTSSSIREFELFQQFCSPTSPTWEASPDRRQTGRSPQQSWTDFDQPPCTPLPPPLDPPPPPAAATSKRLLWATTRVIDEQLNRGGGGGCGVGGGGGSPHNSSSSMSDSQRPHTSASPRKQQRPTQKSLDSGDGRGGGGGGGDDIGKCGRGSAAPCGVVVNPVVSKHVVFYKVELLDGTIFTTQVERKSTGQTLHDLVCQHLNLVERDYFSCSYHDISGVTHWVNKDKKLCKQLSVDDASVYSLAFRVRFYPPDPTVLLHDLTRYLLCLQIQHDITSGRIPCSFMTYALLGSYIAQSQFGDYDSRYHGRGGAGGGAWVEGGARGDGPRSDYLSTLNFSPDPVNSVPALDLRDKIAELHQTHRGQSSTQAELEYLLNASKLALYGVDMHQALDSDGGSVQVGVCSNGLLIYKDKLRVSRYSWPRILKLSYRRNNFYISVRKSTEDHYGGPAAVGTTVSGGSTTGRAGESEGGKESTDCGLRTSMWAGLLDRSDLTVIAFKLANHRLTKRLWRAVIEHHTFFRLKESDPRCRYLPSRVVVNCKETTPSCGTMAKPPRGSGALDNGAPQTFIRAYSQYPSSCAGGIQLNDQSLIPGGPEGSNMTERKCNGENYSEDAAQHQSAADRFGRPTGDNQKRPIRPMLAEAESDIDRLCSPDGSSLITSSLHSPAAILPYTPSRSSLQSGASTVRTQTRTVTYAAPAPAASLSAPFSRSYGGTTGTADLTDDDYGMLVSASSHSSRSHTVEMTTYQTEKDGIVETRVEKRLLLPAGDGLDPVAHDKAVAEALRSMADMHVDRIEIKTCTEIETDG